MHNNFFRNWKHRWSKIFRRQKDKTTKSEKTRIREEVKRLKFLLTSDEKHAQAELVFRKIEQTPEFLKANTVLMYWSMPDELPTHEFIKKWSPEKTILLPVVKGDHMIVSRFTSEDELQKGKWSTLEPNAGHHSQIADLVIVPGVAFDINKQRLGRGGGYYDRYLKHKNIPKWGIGFNFQLYNSVPSASFDIHMDKVITPDRTVE